MEKAIQDAVKTAHDWEANFRASKSWGQQIAKLNWLILSHVPWLIILRQQKNIDLPFDCSAELNVECFIVSTAAVRLELETHNRRYWDTMSTMLHSSILFDIASLNKFIEESINELQRQSSTAKQVHGSYKKIIDASNEVRYRQA